MQSYKTFELNIQQSDVKEENIISFKVLTSTVLRFVF